MTTERNPALILLTQAGAAIANCTALLGEPDVREIQAKLDAAAERVRTHPVYGYQQDEDLR